VPRPPAMKEIGMTSLFVKAIVFGGGPLALAALAYMIYLVAKHA
jgi:hypothetical protein